MDRLRLSLLGTQDFARLYDWRSGFHGFSEAITFPSHRPLLLSLVASRPYDLTVTGDVTLIEVDDEQLVEVGARLFSVNWTEQAKRSGDGRATLTMTNPDKPDQPFVFALTLGVLAYQPDLSALAQQQSKVADLAGAATMVAREGRASWFGNMVAAAQHWEALAGLQLQLARATG